MTIKHQKGKLKKKLDSHLKMVITGGGGVSWDQPAPRLHGVLCLPIQDYRARFCTFLGSQDIGPFPQQWGQDSPQSGSSDRESFLTRPCQLKFFG